MYKRIFLILFFFSVLNFTKAQDLQIGSSLKGVTSSITKDTIIQRMNFGLWVENDFYKYDISSGFSLFISMNYYPVGLLINSDVPYFLFDINGDSILDTKTTNLFVPHWVVSLNSKEKSNNVTNIEKVFNLYYEAFQNNLLYINSEINMDLLSAGTEEIIKAAQDISYLNRDILYIFYLYNNLYRLNEYELCIGYLEILEEIISKRSNKPTHPIILIYKMETLFKMGNYQSAMEVNNMLTKLFPECIPGKVYQVLLETDPYRKTNLKDELIKNHGDHWLVKEKIFPQEVKSTTPP